MTKHHVGREWTGHDMEDACECPQATCGLVILEDADPECSQHGFKFSKTMRQGHPEDRCPGRNDE